MDVEPLFRFLDQVRADLFPSGLRFVQARGHAYTLRKVREEPLAPRIDIVTYDQLIRSRRLPRATYIFTDFDRLTAYDRDLASVIYLRLREAGVPVLNNPARVKTRFALLRALYQAGINRFNVYRVEEGVWPERYPVFLRQECSHTKPLTELLHSREEIERAIEEAVGEGYSVSSLLIVEFCGEPVRPGIYRKLASFRMGKEEFAFVCNHQPHWMVKSTKPGCASDELYREEFRITRENPYREALRRAFAIAEIEFGRVDYGLVGGLPQIYEINTNPNMIHLQTDPDPIRMEALDLYWSNYIAALHKLPRDRDPQGAAVELDHPALRYHQRRSVLFPVRSRFFR
jgi:hypothetical protein